MEILITEVLPKVTKLHTSPPLVTHLIYTVQKRPQYRSSSTCSSYLLGAEKPDKQVYQERVWRATASNHNTYLWLLQHNIWSIGTQLKVPAPCQQVGTRRRNERRGRKREKGGEAISNMYKLENENIFVRV